MKSSVSEMHQHSMKKKTNQLKTAAAAPEAPRRLSPEEREWLAIHRKAGRNIDPETAEVMWDYRCDVDVYGIENPKGWGWSRKYFARSPGSRIWVWFGDLPKATEHSLWEKHKTKLAFPAGLGQIADGHISEGKSNA